MDSNVGASLALELRSLDAQVDDLDLLLGAVKRRIHIAAYGHVIHRPEAVGQLPVLLAGMPCSHKAKKDGWRSSLSFQHAGNLCDLHLYLLLDADHAIGIQTLTDSKVAVIDCGDMDGLLSRPTLASTLWRSSIIEVVDKTQPAKIAEFDDRYLSLPKLASKWTVQVE